MFKRISIFWVLLAALAITSAVPIGVIAFLEVSSAHDEFEEQARTKLREQADSQASIYNEQLETFRLTTDLAATQSQKLLTRHIGTVLSDQEVETRLAKYDWDEFNEYFGLDDWYEEVYAPSLDDDRVSNVFLSIDAEVDDQLAYDIAVTESLDQVFGALSDSLDRSTEIGRHNIFLVTANGMYRQYPYLPREETPFDTLEDVPEFEETGPEFNPDRIPLWLPPGMDFLQGGTLFVANTIPIYDGDTYLGAMVHDLDLTTMTNDVRSLAVGDKGLAFVMDGEGYILMHRDYRPTETWQNLSADEQDRILEDDASIDVFFENEVDVLVADYYPALEGKVESILDSDELNGMYDFTLDSNDEEWVLAYHYIPETDWFLMLLQPKSELTEAATQISDRVQRAGMLMLGIVLISSVLVARRITRPVSHLSETARDIEQHVDDETADLISRDLHRLGDIGTVREIDNLSRVFRQMVLALSSRMRELNSIYTMGQTITANVDYDVTLQSILTAVRQVVQCDAAEIAIKRTNALVVEAWSGEEYYKDSTSHRYRAEDGLIGELLTDPDVIFMPHVPRGTKLAVESEHQVQSLLAIPLMADDSLIGALILVHREAGYFTEDVKRQLTKLSAQASIAIENAVKVKEREDSLKAQISELRVAVDQDKRTLAVGEISESDFFKDLQKNAAKLRRRAAGEQEEDDGEDDSGNEDG